MPLVAGKHTAITSADSTRWRAKRMAAGVWPVRKFVKTNAPRPPRKIRCRAYFATRHQDDDRATLAAMRVPKQLVPGDRVAFEAYSVLAFFSFE
jgi:hypothetical protein